MDERQQTDAENWRVRKRDSLALRQVLSSAARWELTEAETAAILGVTVAHLGEWRSAADCEALEVDEATALRLSALLGIHVALCTLLPTSANQVRWWRAGHCGDLFAGRTPLQLLEQDEERGALLSLRCYLDQSAGW